MWGDNSDTHAVPDNPRSCLNTVPRDAVVVLEQVQERFQTLEDIGACGRPHLFSQYDDNVKSLSS